LTIDANWRNEKTILANAGRHRAARADHQMPPVGPVNELNHRLSEIEFAACVPRGLHLFEQPFPLVKQLNLLVRQRLVRAERAGVKVDLSAELERFKPLESVNQIRATSHDAVIFE